MTDALNRAVAAHARHAAEQRISRNLARDKAGVELEHDLVLSHHPQIIRIVRPFGQNPQLSRGKTDFCQQPRVGTPAVLEDAHDFTRGLVDSPRRQKRGTMIAR